MKNKIAILIIFLLGINLTIRAQNFRKNILAFDIIDANDNGLDVSEYYKTVNAYVNFYQNLNDSIFNLEIVLPESCSKSYGLINAHSLIVKNELYQGHNTDKTYYQWYFINSYDEEKGLADVEFSIVFNADNPFYILRIITHKKFEIFTFKGFINEELTGLTTEIK
jgi:hypothetical protein